MAIPFRPDGFQGSTLPLRQWYGSQFAAGYQPLGQEEAGIRTWDPDYGLNTFAAQGGNPNDLPAYHSWLADKHIPKQFGMSPREWATKNYPMTAEGGYDPETDTFTTMFPDEHHGVAQNFQGPLTILAMALGAGALSGLGAGAGAVGEGALGAGAAGAAEGTGLASIWGNSLPFGSVELGLAGTGAGTGSGIGSNFVGDLPLASDGGLGSGFVGDIPIAGEGGTSIYNNPGLTDIFKQYQMSGQSPTDFLKNLTGVSNVPTGAQSMVQKLFGGGSSNSSTNDWLNLLGKLGAAGLGAYGSNQQANSLNDLAQQYSAQGAPSRARFEASMTPGFDPNSIPGYSGALDSASKNVLARLSASGGNPYGSPGALIDANKAIVSGTALPAINEYQRLNLSAGGLGNLNAAVPALQSQAIGQEGNILNSLGYGLQQITAPQQPSLTDLIKAFNMQGFQ